MRGESLLGLSSSHAPNCRQVAVWRFDHARFERVLRRADGDLLKRRVSMAVRFGWVKPEAWAEGASVPRELSEPDAAKETSGCWSGSSPLSGKACAAATRAESRSAVTGLPGFSTSSTCFERLGASSTESSRRRQWGARDARQCVAFRPRISRRIGQFGHCLSGDDLAGATGRTRPDRPSTVRKRARSRPCVLGRNGGGCSSRNRRALVTDCAGPERLASLSNAGLDVVSCADSSGSVR